VSHLGANKTESAIGTIQLVLSNFDDDIAVPANSSPSLHSETSSEKMILDILQKHHKPKRKYRSISNPRDPLHIKLHDEIIEWTHDYVIICYFDNEHKIL